MFELPPLELSVPAVKIKEKVNNSKPFSAVRDSEYQPMHIPPTTKCLTVPYKSSDNSTGETLYIDLEEEASLSQGKSKITEHGGQYQYLIPSPLVETKSQKDSSATVLKHQGLSFSSSPVHRTSPPVSPVSPVPPVLPVPPVIPVSPVLPVSPVSLSPDRIQSLCSLQDPFLDSPVKTGQNKMQFMKNQHGIPKENLHLQIIQKKIDSQQQHRDCKPLSDTQSDLPRGREDTQSIGQMRGQASLRQSQTGSKVNQSQSLATHDSGCLGVDNVTQATPYSNNSKVWRGREPGTTPQKSPNKRPSKSRVKCITYQLEGRLF